MITLGDIRKATQGMSDKAVMELESTGEGFRVAFRPNPSQEFWRRRRRTPIPTPKPVYVPDPRD